MEPFEELAARIGATPFYAWAGISLVSAGNGEVEVAMDIADHHLNVQGLAHGGMLATLADTAAGLAVRTRLDPGRRHVTVQLNVNYLSPASPGRVLARGRAVLVGAQIAVAEAEVTDERGRALVHATATLAVTADRG